MENILSFTNEENPFGCDNLAEHFVWNKKSNQNIDEHMLL